jgi:hypothetical protein
MLDRLIQYMKGKPGVWFATHEQIARHVKNLMTSGLEATAVCAEVVFVAIFCQSTLAGAARTEERPETLVESRASRYIPGSDLLSHAPSHAVPSAVAGLTSVFGMGTGVTLLL